MANTYIIRGRIYTWRTIMIKNKFMALTLTVALTALSLIHISEPTRPY